jgi:hypothetical protein
MPAASACCAVKVLDLGDTVVLDTASGGVRWTGQHVKPAGIDGDKVLGVRAGESITDPWETVALRGSDGEQLWVGPVLESGSALIGNPPALMLAGSGRAVGAYCGECHCCISWRSIW